MFKKILLMAIIGVLGFTSFASATTTLAQRLSGTILLQVEANGEAWYINPTDSMRYYMKDGAIAYQMMRNFGLGITDTDLTKIPSVSSTSEMKLATSICSTNTTANRLKGKILLQVQQHGEAWYIYPKTCRRIYMKDGEAAYGIMRFLGLGITNKDLSLININESFNNTNSTPATPEPTQPQITEPTQTTTNSTIEGLAYIRASSAQKNWDSDADDDGLEVSIVYYNSSDNIISTMSTVKVPITVDVKLYSERQDSLTPIKDRLVFSKTYSSNEVITNSSIYPLVRIPREQMDVLSTDSTFGILDVSITTPSQGTFSVSQKYLNKIKFN